MIGASGATTVPMSRPSATIPALDPAATAISVRCRATSCSRTAGTADTAETAAVTSGPRIGPATSTSSIITVGVSGSVPIGKRRGPGQVGEGLGVIGGDPALQREPGERAVHRAGVQIAQAQPTRKRPGDGALTRPAGTVHSHDETN